MFRLKNTDYRLVSDSKELDEVLDYYHMKSNANNEDKNYEKWHLGDAKQMGVLWKET